MGLHQHLLCNTSVPETYHDTVIPSKDGKLIESSDEVPASSDISGDKDPKSESREGVHISRVCAVNDGRIRRRPSWM